MGVTINADTKQLFKMGSKNACLCDVTGDASYPAGGYAIDPVLLGMSKIEGCMCLGGNAAGGTVLPHWDIANAKLMAIYPTGGAAASPAALAAPAQGAMTIDNHDDHAADQIGTIPADSTPVTSTAANGAIVTISAADAHSAHVVSAVGSGVPGVGKQLAASTDITTLTWRMLFIGF